MSQDNFDAELFADFIIEAKEHLETIEPNLLELEKAPDNLALLNDIFRPMHSLKGASGFLGLNRINHLAHKAENILEDLRKGAMPVTSEIMDVILSATDALRQIIDNLEQDGTEGEVEIESIIASIEAIMRGESPGEALVVAAAAAPPSVELPVAEAPEVPAAPAPAPPVAEAPAPKASPVAESREVAAMTAAEWIGSLKQLPSYPLTAFGEGHLRDFIEEAHEMNEKLNDGLLELERSPDQPDLVNDLFRYFHNLKGNSGIIGYQELIGLTHEAETLLNRVRHNEMAATHELIDLLLLVTDAMDTLVRTINPAAGTVHPFDTQEILAQLQQAVAGGEIALPEALRASKVQAQPQPQSGTPEIEPPAVIAVGATDEDDATVFCATVMQQRELARVALAELGRDGSQKDYADALFRALTTIQNCASFMDMQDLKVYAERTAGLVNVGRTSDMDFSLMVDLLGQELEIIYDMAMAECQKLFGDRPLPTLEELTADDDDKPKAESPEKSLVDTVADAVGEAHTELSKPEPVVAVKATEPVAPAAPKAPAPAPAKAVAPASTPAPAAGGAARPAAAKAGGDGESKSSSTIRVDHEKLDHLMNLIGELIINRNRYTMLARQLEAEPTQESIQEIAQNLSETTYGMARISDDLQDTIMKVRMVSVSSVFSRFPRLVRDLSRKSGKEVELILEGEETELDKSVVEVIGDPLVHLIRNSVDHGIEPEAERIARGKPVVGRVVLRAFHKGNSVAIEIEDDGKGLDPDVLREVAVRKGLMSADEARLLDDREAKELIFYPGFSSAEQITDISGRGVGMDVVRTNIKNLKGSISIVSEVGKGTRFTLSLPLTLAIIDALMITVSGETFAIPLDAVSETTKLETVRLTDVKGRKAVTLRGEVLGLVELAELLNLPRSEKLPEMLSVVVIHDNERRLGLVVDRLLERQEIVIKPLGAYLGDIKGVSGATIMGDGSVILILDPHEVYLSATSNKGLAQQ